MPDAGDTPETRATPASGDRACRDQIERSRDYGAPVDYGIWRPANQIPGFRQPAPSGRPADPYPFPIKMFPEYGADLPLWPQGWMSLSQLPLSDELRAALAAWNEFYDAHHHWETGWNVDPGVFNRRGRELFELTRIELGPDYLLTYDYAPNL